MWIDLSYPLYVSLFPFVPLPPLSPLPPLGSFCLHIPFFSFILFCPPLFPSPLLLCSCYLVIPFFRPIFVPYRSFPTFCPPLSPFVCFSPLFEARGIYGCINVVKVYQSVCTEILPVGTTSSLLPVGTTSYLLPVCTTSSLFLTTVSDKDSIWILLNFGIWKYISFGLWLYDFPLLADY